MQCIPLLVPTYKKPQAGRQLKHFFSDSSNLVQSTNVISTSEFVKR